MNTEEEYCYSHNEEDFTEEFEDAAELAYDSFFPWDHEKQKNFKPPETFTVWRGKRRPWKAQEFFPKADEFFERMAEAACGELGEYADGFLDKVTPEMEKDLNESLWGLVAKWADKNNLHPTAYSVHSIEPLTVKLTEGDNFEIVE